MPRQVQRLLKKCLEKDPRRRLRDIGDVWELLDEALEASLQAFAVWKRRLGRCRCPGDCRGDRAVGAVARAGAARSIGRSSASRSISAQMFRLPSLVVPTPSSVAISPDGTRLVYVASVVRRSATAVHCGGSISQRPPSLPVRKARRTRSSRATDSGWRSYDGRDSRRSRSRAARSVPLMEAAIFAGADWTDDANLLVGSGLATGIVAGALPRAARPRRFSIPVGDETFLRDAVECCPAARIVLVTVYGTPPRHRHARSSTSVSLTDRSRKTIARGGTAARYLPSGHLIYTQPQHHVRGAVRPRCARNARHRGSGAERRRVRPRCGNAAVRHLPGRHARLPPAHRSGGGAGSLSGSMRPASDGAAGQAGAVCRHATPVSRWQEARDRRSGMAAARTSGSTTSSVTR